MKVDRAPKRRRRPMRGSPCRSSANAQALRVRNLTRVGCLRRPIESASGVQASDAGLSKRLGMQPQMIELPERTSEDVALGLHGGHPGRGLDVQASSDRRELRIDEADLVVTNRSTSPINESEILRKRERNAGSVRFAIPKPQQRWAR